VAACRNWRRDVAGATFSYARAQVPPLRGDGIRAIKESWAQIQAAGIQAEVWRWG